MDPFDCRGIGPPDNDPELHLWLSVSGDIDDFIFYQEAEKPCSER